MASGAPTSLPPGARTVLLAPSAFTRALAAADGDPERRWMFRLPRPVRRSFVAEVLDGGAGRLSRERWMVLQDDDVRESYVQQVLLQLAEPDAQAVCWEPNLVGEGPLTLEAAGRLAERADGRGMVEHEGGWYVLEDKPALTNRDLAGAEQIIDRGAGEPSVALRFTEDGKTAFHELTRDVARRGADLAAPGVPAIENAHHFAIVVDGRVRGQSPHPPGRKTGRPRCPGPTDARTPRPD